MKKSTLRNFSPMQRRVIAAAVSGRADVLDKNGKPVLDKDGVVQQQSDGRTQGQYKNECDINVVVATYRRADEPFPAQRTSGPGQYADLPDETDLHSSLNKVAAATNAFNELPSHVRERYHNNAVEFVAALKNPDETDFLVENRVLEAREFTLWPKPTRKKSEAPTGPQNAPEDGAE